MRGVRLACRRNRQRAGVLPYRQRWLPGRAGEGRTVSEQAAVAALVRCRRMRIGLMGCRVVDQAGMAFAPTAEIRRPRRGGDGLRDHRRDDGEPHGEQPQPCNQPSMSWFTDQEPAPVSHLLSMGCRGICRATGNCPMGLPRMGCDTGSRRWCLWVGGDLIDPALKRLCTAPFDFPAPRSERTAWGQRKWDTASNAAN